MQSYVKIKPSGIGVITLSFTVISKSCPVRDFLRRQYDFFLKFSQKFPNLKYRLAKQSLGRLISPRAFLLFIPGFWPHSIMSL